MKSRISPEDVCFSDVVPAQPRILTMRNILQWATKDAKMGVYTES